MPRPCPKRVRQLKQYTPNCKTSFPVYFFPSQAFLAFGQIHFSLFFGKTETVCLVFGRNHLSLFFGKTETCEGKKMGNIVLRFGVELVMLEPPLAVFQRHNAHVPAAQSGKLATLEPPLVMFQRHDAQAPAA